MSELTSPETVEGKKVFKINGRILRPVIPLFGFGTFLMINLRTAKMMKRKIWGIGHSSVMITMKHDVTMYAHMLGLESTFETKTLSTGKKIRVEKRVNATPFQMLSWKLSCGLDYAGNNMNLGIRPKDLETLIRKAIKKGLVQDSGVSYFFYMIRSNDLERKMLPNEKDHWLIFPNAESIKQRIIPINEALAKTNSEWRLKQTLRIEDIVRALAKQQTVKSE